jgi:hypothetical protein
MQLFKMFQNDQSDVEKVIHYNKLKDFVLSSRYTEAISYITIYQEFVYAKELYEIVLIYGSLPAFMYYTNYFITQDLVGRPYFTKMISRYPLHSMLLKSVVNMVNVDYFEALFDYFPDSRPKLGDLLNVLERGNIDLLRLYAVKVDHLISGKTFVEDDHEEPVLDVKRFVYSLKYECETDYIHKVSEVVRMIPVLQEMVVDQLMDPVSRSIISKEYFLESLFKSILDSGFEFADKDQYISKNFSFVRSNSSTNSLHDLI